MPLKAKLILLALLPLLIATASISLISIHQAKTLEKREIEILRAKLMEERETSRKDSVEEAFDAVRLIGGNPNLS